MPAPNPTSLIIPVNEAAFLQPFRAKYLHQPGVTMPPHITVQSPFNSVDAIDAEVMMTLQTVCGSCPQFRFTLTKTGRFADPGVLYLAPEPTDGFIALHHTIRARFPTSAAAQPVFHLTLAGWHPINLKPIEEEFYQAYGNHLPIQARATEVGLFEQRGNGWVQHATFALAKPGAEG